MPLKIWGWKRMTSYNNSRKRKDYEHIRSLIPLYVKGSLEDKERADVESAIDEYPELKKEVEEWERIQGAYRLMEERLPEPSVDLYSRIINRIEEGREGTFVQRLRQWFSRFKPSPVLPLALILAQLIIIIAGGVYIVREQTGYRTLSSQGVTQADLIKINVVFNEHATEADIRSLLLELNGKILDGPYTSGLYIIGVPSDGIEAALRKLKDSPIVVLAERSY